MKFGKGACQEESGDMVCKSVGVGEGMHDDV